MDGVRLGGARTSGARRRGLPLSVLILRYFAYVLAGVLAAAIAAYLAFAIGVGGSSVYPANYGDTALEETTARIVALEGDDLDAFDAAIPSCYRWALFAADGAYLGGDMGQGAREAAHEAAFDGLAIAYHQLGMTRYEPVTLDDGSVCVLVYEYLPQFVSKGLRDALPNPQNLIVGMFALLSVLVLVGVAARAARVISRKMRPLEEAARRIEERDLDFAVGSSRVREIDDVLGAMDDMRASLKDSLEAQWRSEQAQREQVAALAHDLKTPLTVVRGNVELLLEGSLDDDARACAVDVAEGARQMGTYLDALIDVSRGRALTFAPTACDLRACTARLRASAEALAAASGVHVAWREDAQLPATLTMDETLVERAVMNVVTNAVEFAPAGSTVEVDVRGEGDDVALSVSDAGPGFSPEALRRGCERFYQGDPARGDRGHSGLGLHVAAEAAERHGGTVELANREDAPGARVTLRLPRA